MKRTFLGLMVLATLVVGSCGKNTGGCRKGEKAWVEDYSDSDTCGIVFKLEDGTKLEATNLAEFSNMQFEHGDLLWVSYKETSGASTCGLGEIVEMKCIAERPY